MMNFYKHASVPETIEVSFNMQQNYSEAYKYVWEMGINIREIMFMMCATAHTDFHILLRTLFIFYLCFCLGNICTPGMLSLAF